jgi:membrane protein YqaA with SNARE-associated domain
MSEAAALWALALSAFTSATVLPGTSEISLLAFAKSFPASSVAGFIVATLANTTGGLTSYVLGRFIPTPQIEQNISSSTLARVQRLGPWALLFSWVPIVGDALCVAAGALRLNVWASALALLVGKAVRYALVLGAFKSIFSV